MDKNVVEWSHNLIKRCDKPVYNSRGSVPVVVFVCSLIKKSEVIARKAVVIECLGVKKTLLERIVYCCWKDCFVKIASTLGDA